MKTTTTIATSVIDSTTQRIQDRESHTCRYCFALQDRTSFQQSPELAPKRASLPLQGRFSGRLETKLDEKRLAEECKLLGPLLGGSGKRGERSRLTLAKIVRGIASGDVRRYCEQRERKIEVSMPQRSGMSRPRSWCFPWAHLRLPAGASSTHGRQRSTQCSE